ncbi:hypothetical protein PMAYCL1PPCAC_31525 [Pristionchus mayeri]|uniref:Lipase n=1 Tax=Pristionchus mayeri TaxID=1317129 RepID=A0AAN5DFV9_9BILA|nr:hypothetical protein PMAYCL1PPCAC_31525 [Pristionchus mayeri]
MNLLFALATAAAAAASSQHGPFTKDLVEFLEKSPQLNEYLLSVYKDFGETGSFGGRATKGEKISRQPVVFVHGSSDSALHHSKMASGWTNSVEYFKEHGYSTSELYGLTYGSRDINYSLESRIMCRDLLGLRRFIEVILQYTEASKIDIIAHSMGVTMARMAVKGGEVHLMGESCHLGSSLADRIDAFVGISGANYGLCMCLMSGLTHLPACGQSGFAPGKCGRSRASIADCMDDTGCDGEDDYASVLSSTNAAGEKTADFVASLWSDGDSFLGRNNLVWGRKTSLIPGSDLSHTYTKMDHFQTKDKTLRDQLSLVNEHAIHIGRTKRHH